MQRAMVAITRSSERPLEETRRSRVAVSTAGGWRAEQSPNMKIERFAERMLVDRFAAMPGTANWSQPRTHGRDTILMRGHAVRCAAFGARTDD